MTHATTTARRDEQTAARVEKLSISLTPDMATWLRRCAARKGSNVSQVLRELIMPAYEARHAK